MHWYGGFTEVCGSGGDIRLRIFDLAGRSCWNSLKAVILDQSVLLRVKSVLSLIFLLISFLLIFWCSAMAPSDNAVIECVLLCVVRPVGWRHAAVGVQQDAETAHDEQRQEDEEQEHEDECHLLLQRQVGWHVMATTWRGQRTAEEALSHPGHIHTWASGLQLFVGWCSDFGEEDGSTTEDLQENPNGWIRNGDCLLSSVMTTQCNYRKRKCLKSQGFKLMRGTKQNKKSGSWCRFRATGKLSVLWWNNDLRALTLNFCGSFGTLEF